MAKLRSREVEVASVVEETLTLAHFEDKTPSANCRTVTGCRNGGGDILTPSSGCVTETVRRSARLNVRVNPVSFAPGSNLEQESPSTAAANNGGDGAMVDRQDSSVKKDNGGSSSRVRGKGNGISRGRGKRKVMKLLLHSLVLQGIACRVFPSTV